MLWKTRTRTKIMTIALVLVGLWSNLVIWAWAFKDKDDAPEMLGVILGAGGLSFITFLWTIMNENNKRGT
jgi:hypothetical protein